MSIDHLEQLSEALADRLAAATFVVAIRTGRRGASGVLWRDDVVVASEQTLPEGIDFTVVRGGTEYRRAWQAATPAPTSPCCACRRSWPRRCRRRRQLLARARLP